MGELIGNSISFFIPCLNEEGNIGRTIDTIVDAMKNLEAPYELLVVDDASEDGTVAEVWERCRRYPQTRIEVIRNPFCRGLGRNYFIAAQRANGEYLMLVNGDGAEPPESILAILSHKGEADAIVPYFARNDSRTLPRKVLSWTFTFLVNIFSGHRLKYYNGPVLHKTENVRMWFSETAGFAYQAELLCRLLDEGISVVEVQIANNDRESGISKAFTIPNLLSVANALFHILLRRFERVAWNLLTPSNKRKHPRLRKPTIVHTQDAEKTGLGWESVLAWAETKRTYSLVARPRSLEDCVRVVEFARKHELTICPRGAGYSYGDMILNDGQIVLDACRMNRILSWNEQTGHLTAEPGVVFAQILRETLGRCWTIGSCVGGMGVTVAGAVSNNVHGKDSWKIGNFGDHIIELKLLTASGDIARVSKSADLELFRAVVGGMGLLGVIVEVTLQLRKAPSPFVEATTTPVRDLAESLDVMEQAREHADFAIAWVDAFAAGKGLGRGTVETARWIETDRHMDKTHLEDSLIVPRRIFGLLPATPTWSVARPFFRPGMIKFANAAKYSWDRWRGHKSAEMLFTDFNFMLNRIPGWKHLYRPYGYMEFQPMLPRRSGVKTLAEVLRMCHAHGMESLLCGVKPHPPDDYMLSYEGDGYSIGIDIALRGRNGRSVEQFARNLYSYVADQDGKTFLAKDEILPRDLFERMYPRHRDFLQVKRRIDPQNLFASDMYRRLLV